MDGKLTIIFINISEKAKFSFNKEFKRQINLIVVKFIYLFEKIIKFGSPLVLKPQFIRIINI